MTIKDPMKSLDKQFSLCWNFLLKHLKLQSKLMTLGRFYAALGNVNASHYKQTKHFPYFHKRHKHKRTVGVGKNIDFYY